LDLTRYEKSLVSKPIGKGLLKWLSSGFGEIDKSFSESVEEDLKTMKSFIRWAAGHGIVNEYGRDDRKAEDICLQFENFEIVRKRLIKGSREKEIFLTDKGKKLCEEVLKK